MRLRLVVLALVALPFFGCKKANEQDCRKAIENVFALRGVARPEGAPEVEAEVRKCRTSASPSEVDCLMKAKTAADLDACEGKKK